MRLHPRLVEARFIARLNRFAALVELEVRLPQPALSAEPSLKASQV
ncbi:MAG: hypothetical protein ACE5IG_04130 [Dehalococcoidia bacterium]